MNDGVSAGLLAYFGFGIVGALFEPDLHGLPCFDEVDELLRVYLLNVLFIAFVK